MLLTRNGRFHHDVIYMEKATAKSEDVSDTTVLLHAIRQAFSNLGIDRKQLDDMVNKIDPTIMHQQSHLPPKEDWNQFVSSLAGKAPFYVSIEPKGNRLFSITPSKTKTKFIAPDGLGDRVKIYIEPSNTPQQAESAIDIGIFEFAGAGTKGSTFVSIIPAQFKKTNNNDLYIGDTSGIIETSQGQQPAQTQAQNQTQQPAPQAPPAQAQQPAAAAQAQPQVQPQTQQTPQAQQQTQGGKTTWDQLKTMVSKGQQFIFKTASDEYGGPWYLYKSDEPGNFFGFASQYNDGSYQVYPNPGWFRPDDQPFHEHYDDMDAAFEGVVKDGMGGVVKNIAPAIFAPDNSTKGQQQGRYKLIEKGIVEQEPDTSQK